MGMLDRLLGDLVASSTNLPPHVTRGLVRKAGGSKLLIAGGAALAGAMIAQHLQSRQSQGAAQPAVPPPPPPGPGPQPGFAPPPLSGSAPGPAAADLGWAPPPLPPELAAGAGATPPATPPAGGSDEGATNEEVELPAGLLFPVVRTMVAAALADGELEPAEREAISGHLESGELTPSETAQVRRDLVLPATPGELAAMVEAPESGELLYRFAFLTLRADGELEPHEAAWLEQLAEALAIGPVDRERLQAALGLDAR